MHHFLCNSSLLGPHVHTHDGFVKRNSRKCDKMPPVFRLNSIDHNPNLLPPLIPNWWLTFFLIFTGKKPSCPLSADQRRPACCEATVVSHADKQKVKRRAGNTVSHFWCSCGTSLKWPNPTFHKVVDKFDLKKENNNPPPLIKDLYAVYNYRTISLTFCADCFFPRTRLPPPSQRHVHVGQKLRT